MDSNTFIKLSPETVEFLQSANLGCVNGRSLQSELISFQKEHHVSNLSSPGYGSDVSNPVYGATTHDMMSRLTGKYWEFAPKTPDGYLIRSPRFNEVFRSIMEDIINSDADSIRSDIYPEDLDRLEDLEEYHQRFLNRLFVLDQDVSNYNPYDLLNPDKLTLTDIKNIMNSRYFMYQVDDYWIEQVRQYFGMTFDEILTQELNLIQQSELCPVTALQPKQILYQQISLSELSGIFSSGTVTRFTPSPELQDLTRSPNQVFLIYTMNRTIPYMVIARYDPSINQLLPQV
jgi:hypothetical protein